MSSAPEEGRKTPSPKSQAEGGEDDRRRKDQEKEKNGKGDSCFHDDLAAIIAAAAGFYTREEWGLVSFRSGIHKTAANAENNRGG